ncbi:CoA transferase [Yinghuangia sp. KLBMP8922]|uniref:CoA transferase n=2 Tax=Yinghuangia soli TaxID=2908204 RepID=A0AA41PTN0_9ACTN|nr:CoA transferase [Yinghuangia soli]
MDAWAATQQADAAYRQALLLDIPAALPDRRQRARHPSPSARPRAFPGRLPHGVRVPRDTWQPSTPALRAVPEKSAPGPAWSTPRPRPLVVDLSSLWAGPLCAHLLGLAGARVVKVESTRRPDGARSGPSDFYDLLHGGHESVAFDFTRPADLARLEAVLSLADVVIEASRPRALAQLGIDPAAVAAARPGQTWVSITAYGRTGPDANRPGFGDDVAFEAGLHDTAPDDPDTPTVHGDAIADPLTGVHAAVAAMSGLVTGGGAMFDVSMYDAVTLALSTAPRSRKAPAPRRTPRPRSGARTSAPPPHKAPELGAHTAAFLAEFDIA